MEDVLLNCLTIGSAFSACGRWGLLVSKGNLCLPLCSWTGMSRNSQLAWCQISSGSSLNIKMPLSTPSRHSIPHLPVDSTPSTGTSSKTSGNWSLSFGSRRYPSE
ncbi:hypothetical protein DSO57_1020795 [Entomophthora muscae]|uniref:Uncharacterized protein n=1 Tax=Entomophthora muscae TaxID=34485 RepID=A0ACC2T3P9_9FUNG|nr:hypothetical protein DSO57_1020795 [Entomophthora muscae]